MSNFGMPRHLRSAWRLCSTVVSPSRPCLVRTSLIEKVQNKPRLTSKQQILTLTRGHSNSSDSISLANFKNAGRKSRRNTAERLHQRVLTDEEKAEEAKLRASCVSENLPEEDTFGAVYRGGKHKERLRTHQKVQPHSFGDGTELENAKPGFRSVHQENSSISISAFGDKRSANRQAAFKSHRHNRAGDRYADTFGTLQEDDFDDRIKESLTSEVGSHEERFSAEEDEDPDDRSHIRLSPTGRRHIPHWYGRKITRLNKKGRLKESLEVFEEWMLKKDRVMPNAYVFTSLITGLGHAGYTKKAFQLFNKMKKMGIQPKPQTYTALFNACANSPWHQDGLSRADNLYRLMQERGIEPTFITRKAMIKAFAVCGDVRRAFALMDELSRAHKPDAEAFSPLLMACVSDREAGLRHAIQVWRLMQRMNVQPDLPLYNLFIRCVRDCGVGDAKTVNDLLGETAASTSRQVLTTGKEARRLKDVSLLESKASGSCSRRSLKYVQSKSQHEASVELHEIDLHSVQRECNADSDVLQRDQSKTMMSADDVISVSAPPAIPDLLSPACDVSGIMSLGDLSSKESQLALVGGVEGILGRMVEDRVKPSVITFTQLITVAPPTLEAEVLEFMKKMEVKPDIDLFNALIHKRCMRRDMESAQDVKPLISQYKLTSNLRTFGVLAMTCSSQGDAAQLLQEMEVADLQPNMEILGTFIYAAKTNFNYMLWVLREAENLDLAPNTRFLQNIEKALAYSRKMIVQAEEKGDVYSYFLSPLFQQSYERFMQHYEKWLQRNNVDIPPQPWAVFQPKQDSENQHVAKSV